MMDLKEIIKWFIPCFHILLVVLNKKEARLTFICLFLLFNFRGACAGSVKSVGIINAKNVDSVYENKLKNQSDVVVKAREFPQFNDGSVGRTFGRPFKKMMGALIPLIFQIGAASTWAVVAALVGVKTLAVTLIILKILLIAGAAKALALAAKQVNDIREKASNPAYSVPSYYLQKNGKDHASADSQWVQALALAAKHNEVNNGREKLGYPGNVVNPGTWYLLSNGKKTNSSYNERLQVGALFGAKGGHGHYQGWEPPPPQKEIHLHIHNGHQTTHEEHTPYGSWSREDGTTLVESKHPAIEQYPIAGPQTIRTPFGNYVKVESNEQIQQLQYPT